jgi:hypothetical protein
MKEDKSEDFQNNADRDTPTETQRMNMDQLEIEQSVREIISYFK